MDTVARKVMELYTNQKGKRKTEFNDLELQCLVGQGLVFPQAYDALTCVWCRKQEKLFRLQSLAAVFQHFESQSHVRSQDDGEVTHTHPAPQEQQPQVEQKQEPSTRSRQTRSQSTTHRAPVWSGRATNISPPVMSCPRSNTKQFCVDRATCRSICLRGFELSLALCTTSTRGCRSTVQSKSWFFRTACLQSFSRPFSTKPPSKARRGVSLFAASRKPLPSPANRSS